MDPETHKYTVSRDVVFDEVSSYYGPHQVLDEQDGSGSSKTNEQIIQVPSDNESVEKETQGERGSIDQDEEEEHE